jgi:hypothetical protein
MKERSTSISVLRRPTGPRTVEGKRQSSKNALKHGIFSKHLFLEGERRADFEKLHRGLQEDFQPEGTMEHVLIEQLATLVWRSRRVVAAETAMIAKSPTFIGVVDKPHADLPNQPRLQSDLTDRKTVTTLTDGEKVITRTEGNKVTTKTELILETAKKLAKLRENIKERGVGYIEDVRLLFEAYGEFDERGDLCDDFLFALAGYRKYGGDTKSKDHIANFVIESIDVEICRLGTLLQQVESDEVVFNSLASLIPPQADLDRTLRYESHLSREIDRKLTQLERLQRARRGHPPVPSIKIDLD